MVVVVVVAAIVNAIFNCLSAVFVGGGIAGPEWAMFWRCYYSTNQQHMHFLLLGNNEI